MINIHGVGLFGGAIAVVVATCLAAELSAQGGPSEAINVCVGADRVLRLVDAKESCEPGQKRLLLEHAKPEAETLKAEPDEPRPKPGPSEARIRTLEEEVRQLQRELVKSRELTFRAPFVIVDDAGKAIFTIRQSGKGPTLELQNGGVSLVTLGVTPAGNNGLRIMTISGQPSASLGAYPAGYGGLVLTDGTENVTAWAMGGGPNRGASIAVFRNNVALAFLGVGNNGGKLELSDNGGMVTADGGVLNSGAGVFRVRGQVFAYIAGQKMRLPAW